MTSEEIIQQSVNVRNLAQLMDPDYSYDDPILLLNLLCVAGFKLVALTEQDFDEEGVSIVSKAYMYTIVENIESSHHNLDAFKEEQVQTIEDFDDIQDDLDEDLWDDLGDED